MELRLTFSSQLRKGLFTGIIFSSVSVITTIIVRITDRIGPSPILSVIHIITIDTMINFNGGNNGREL